MEINRTNIIYPNPREKSESEKIAESRLTPENVHRVFNNCRMIIGETGMPNYPHNFVEDTVFNEDKLTENSNIIRIFANQLHEDLFNKKTLGTNIEFAFYKKGTPRADIESAYRKGKKHESAWTKDQNFRNELLALITAVKMGRKTSSNSVLKRSPPRDRYLRYLIDIEACAKNHLEKIYL